MLFDDFCYVPWGRESTVVPLSPAPPVITIVPAQNKVREEENKFKTDLHTLSYHWNTERFRARGRIFKDIIIIISIIAIIAFVAIWNTAL